MAATIEERRGPVAPAQTQMTYRPAGDGPAAARNGEDRVVPASRSNARSVAGYAAMALAFVACPCHLPLTLGVAAAVVGGTAGAAAVMANLGALLAGGAVLFLALLGIGWWLLSERPA